MNDLKRMPVAVQKAIGTALRDLQFGARPRGIKRLTGLGGGVLEIVDDFDRSTYRAVLTVEFEDAIYVLHVFQKKSKRGLATPRQDVEKIVRRLRVARSLHRGLHNE
ncbi:MAG TPA: type II toxin-antitoxin system RelE/ParE family toxin [Gemmatimonadaceae bacterium]|nr:type II toxin-antitoxin system RelE/ParE family toxin [Gemmatimonadaceae bacterium]